MLSAMIALGHRMLLKIKMSPHLDCIPPPDDAADAEDVTDQDGRPDGADSAGSGRGSAD